MMIDAAPILSGTMYQFENYEISMLCASAKEATRRHKEKVN